jgi:hypothetical protein
VKVISHPFIEQKDSGYCDLPFGDYATANLSVHAETNWDAQDRADSGFTQSVLPAYVIKKLLKPPEYYGDPAPFAVEGEIDKATGETVRWVRYRPLPRPRTEAATTQMGAPLDLTADAVTATLEIWEAFTRFTTRANFYLGHSVLENALNRHNELYHRVGRLNIFDVLIAGTNTFYGGSATSIPTLATSSNDVAIKIAKVITKFRRVGSMPCDGMYYPVFCNPDIIEILNADTTYVAAESFQGKGLYNFQTPHWKGAAWYPTNLLPIRQLQAALAAAGTGTTGGTIADADEGFYKVAAINPLTGQIEYVTAETSKTVGTSANTNTITIVMPAATAIELEANTNYVYDVYVGETTGDANLYLFSSDNAAASTVTITAIDGTSGATAPAAPASGVKVTPLIVLAEEAYGLTHSKLNPYGKFKPAIVPGTPTAGNEVGKIRSVGWSLDMKAVILNQARMAVLWIGYA